MKFAIIFAILVAATLQQADTPQSIKCAHFVLGLKGTLVAMKTGGSIFEKVSVVMEVFADFKGSNGQACKGLSAQQVKQAITHCLKKTDHVSPACVNCLTNLVEGVEANID